MVADCPANCARWILCLANFVFIVSKESDLMTPFSFIAFFIHRSRHLRPWQAMRDCWIIFWHCRFDDNLQFPIILRKFFMRPQPTPISRAPAVGVCAVGCGL